MWTHDKLKPKNWKGEPVAVKQQKYNGHRFTMFKQADGQLVGFESSSSTMPESREIRVKRPGIVKYNWWKKFVLNMLPMSSVDGELYIPGGNAGDAAHAIAECSDDLEFIPFAFPWWNGKEIYDEPVVTAQNIANRIIGINFAKTLPIQPDDTYDVLCHHAVKLGIEGWVLKLSNYKGWYKVKPQKEIDCIVTGFKDGDGKYLGLVGALKVSVLIEGNKSAYSDDTTLDYHGFNAPAKYQLTEIASVSGMSDEIRIDIDEDKDLGRVCEVEYQEVGNGGRLIHAHFICWRDDKSAEECVCNRSDL